MTRIGMVLGGGGSVGVAYHGGVLAAVEEATGWDPRTASIVVGTSAGSLTAGLLRSGLPAADLRAVSEGLPLSAEGSLLAEIGQPHRPRAHATDFLGLRRLGDPGAALRSLRRPWRINPLALWSALMPEGPVVTDSISGGLDEVADGRWPGAPLWVCAVRLRDGHRVVFGRRGSPEASLGRAVAASCAIPAYFRPVTIGRDRYVDGGVASMHHADLLADEDLDAVIVSAPMSWAGQRPPLRADIAVRQSVRFQLDREIAKLRRRGVPVLTVAPDRRVLTAMGMDPMDARRRHVVSRQARLETLRQMQCSPVAGILADAGRTDVGPTARPTDGRLLLSS